MFNFIVSLE